MPRERNDRPVSESQRSQMGEGYKSESVTVNFRTFQIPNCLNGKPGNNDHALLVRKANYDACESALYAETRIASQVCPVCSGTVIVSPSLTEAGINAFFIDGGKIGQPYVEFRPFRGHGGG